MKLRLINNGGGDDPPPLTPQQRQEWNAYVDWIEKKGYKGSPLLDKQETGLAKSLFEQFKKENPNVSLTLNHVSSVQTEMQKLADSVRSFEARRGNPNAQNMMQGTSKVDGWPGSKTTSFKFPAMSKEEYTNGSLTNKTNFGIIDPKLRPTDSLRVGGLMNPNRTASTTLPAGVERMQDGKLYYQNKDGDWVMYNQK